MFGDSFMSPNSEALRIMQVFSILQRTISCQMVPVSNSIRHLCLSKSGTSLPSSRQAKWRDEPHRWKMVFIIPSIYKSLTCLQVELSPKSLEESSEVRRVSVVMFFKVPSALWLPAADPAGGLVSADLWDPESPGVILKYVLSHKVLILDVLTSHNHCPTVFT